MTISLRKFRPLALGLGLATLGLAANPAAAAILANGDFEQPGGVNAFYELTTNNLPGWTYAEGASGAGPGASNDYYTSDNFWGLTAANGSHYVIFGGNTTWGGSISQTFATVAGATYKVTYKVAEQQGDDSSQILRAMITNGLQSISQDNSGLNFGAFADGASLTFVATGSSATLTFLDATPAGGGGPSNIGLDAVAVAQIAGPGPGPAVPEPATWALMILGFGLIGGSARARRGHRLSA